MDFRETVIASLDKIMASGAVEQIIEDTLAKTVKAVIENALREYGDFGKQIEAAVKKSFALNGELDLPCYNDTILKIVRRQVEGYTNDVIQKQVAANLERLLEPAPAEIKLSDLVAKYVEEQKDKSSSDCVCYGERQTVEVEVKDDERLAGFKKIYLSESPRKIETTFSGLPRAKPPADITIGTHYGEVYHLTYKDADVEKGMFAGPLHDFERLVFQMKAAKSKIIFDCDPSDLELSYGEHID
jgi:hypothetical protein